MAENYYLNHTATQIDAILNKVDGMEAGAQANVQSDWNEADNTKDDFIKNKPSLGAAAAKNVDSAPTDSSENLVESGGVYAALSGKVDTNGTDSLMTADEHTKLSGIESGAEVNVQSDWNQNDSTADDFVKNKPTLGTASALNVPASGDAATTEVVKGDDSRLTDARHADDVYSWAKDATKPTYTASEVGAVDESNVITTTEIDLMFA